MNIFKSSLLTFLISFSLITPLYSFAADTSSAQPTTTVQADQSTLVASVNIINAKIISQDSNTFNISFDLSNGKGLQTGVKYGVQLIPDGANYIADEKAYEESLTLYENATVKKQITYTAPSQFSGDYTLVLSSKNESNFPFGVVSLGKVKLTASTKGILISNQSCYLKVEGEKSNPHYTLTQSVDISASESLRLTCDAVNNSDATVAVTPSFETRYFSAYGKVAPQAGGDSTAISFAKGEKKTLSILLPKGDKPQFYTMKVSLSNSETSSNSLSIPYIIRGTSASIEKISLDKDSYKTGDKGILSILWSASAGNFARGSTTEPAVPTVSLSATITGDNSSECATPIKQALTRDPSGPMTMVPFDIKADCKNPSISATINDEQGKILDQKGFNFKSNTTTTPTSTTGQASNSLYIILGIILVVIIVLALYMKKKKNPDVNNTNV